MPASSLKSPPKSFVQGDTVSFGLAYGTYPSSTYSLKWVLSNLGQLVKSVDGVSQSDNSWQITLSATDSALIKPGQLTYSVVVTDGSGVRTTLEGGEIFVTPDLSQSLAATIAQQQLAAVESAILTLTSGTNESATINGQSYKKKDLKSLYDLRDRIQARVNAELRRLGLSNKGGAVTIVTRFRAP